MILDSAWTPGLAFSILAVLAYLWPALRARRQGAVVARVWVAIAWLAHAATLVMAFLDPPARFGFAPALSVTAWLIATSYAVESQVFPQLPARWALSALGAVSVVLA
jgi:hypothetical protein